MSLEITQKLWKEKIKSFERRAYNIIFQSQNSKRSKFLKVRDLQKKRICVQVFNCLSGNICENFANYFDVMVNNTRNKNKLIRLPRVRLQCSKKSFRFTGAKIYNELPIKIRDASTLNDFNKIYNQLFNI